MCGRFTLKTPPDQWTQLLLPIVDLSAIQAEWQPRYNIAPTQDILALARVGDDRPSVSAQYFRWGLVPFWANDLSIGNRMINARSETLSEKRSFATPLKKRRCLIVADGYYEWQKTGSKTKQPYWITPRVGGVIQFAGLWERNTRLDATPVLSCTIITTPAANALAEIHDRMPAVLMGPAAEQWMDPECTAEEAASLLGPTDDDFFQTQKVSTHVNNARHEDPQCIEAG